MVTYWTKIPFWLKIAFPGGLVWEMPANGTPTVYITFDDGPHPTATPYALQQLEKFNAHATFFCVGDNVARYPEIYSTVLAAGHATANHTFNHMNGWKTADATYLANIEKAKKFIDSNLFRPPYGLIKRSQVREIRKRYPDFKIIMWSALSGDFDQKLNGTQVLQNVMKRIQPGAIVLFHDSAKAWERMEYALPKVLAHCQKNNWQMKALPMNGDF